MKWRDVVIAADELVADSGTATIDIGVRNPISALFVGFYFDNHASTNCDDYPPEKVITKIELVDGGQVYMSMTGQEAVAAACYDGGRWPGVWYEEYHGFRQRIYLPIFFGRYPGDPEYAFDPTRLVNPQLKVTWAISSTYHKTSSVYLGVYAKVMEEATSPAACLLWKGVESWTTAGSGDKRVDMPVDYPYRRLLIRAWTALVAPQSHFSAFKLDCDLGKYIPFDVTERQFREMMKAVFPPFSFDKVDVLDNAESRETWLGITQKAVVEVSLAGICTNSWASGRSYYQAYIFNHAGTAQSDQRVAAWVTGYLPHSCWAYQFGLPDKPETWFPSRTYKDIRLYITQIRADGAGSVLLQQPRTLP